MGSEAERPQRYCTHDRCRSRRRPPSRSLIRIIRVLEYGIEPTCIRPVPIVLAGRTERRAGLRRPPLTAAAALSMCTPRQPRASSTPQRPCATRGTPCQQPQQQQQPRLHPTRVRAAPPPQLTEVGRGPWRRGRPPSRIRSFDGDIILSQIFEIGNQKMSSVAIFVCD